MHHYFSKTKVVRPILVTGVNGYPLVEGHMFRRRMN